MVRFKNRWFVVEFIPISTSTPLASTSDSRASLSNDTFDGFNGKQIYSALKQSVLCHYGDVGWGAVGLSLTVKYYSPQTHLCILRVARDHHKIAWGAITLLQLELEGTQVRWVPHVVHVSGTIKQAQIAAISHNRVVIARFRASAKAGAKAGVGSNSYHAHTPAAPNMSLGSDMHMDSYDAYLESSSREIEALQD
ncbi:hypothetical protein BT96DRAFT_854384 [Gymnopus androsaceus JB14]|uniref:Uncharacterized protein n=1 Tax=Gymnopus androsaceus JB14 TaxID=1447944 RepID=A0A6A4I0A3_9AGAR|nr:hypothetical protein BT96DRAFT_854384 [Gymnopus androsaceus JB14]